jgi:hypothetical protein
MTIYIRDYSIIQACKLQRLFALALGEIYKYIYIYVCRIAS